MPEFCMYLSTCPDRQVAEKLAGLAVEQRLTACVQISGPITSVYRWQDEIQQDEEYKLVFKSRPECEQALFELVSLHHPYDVPQWLSIAIEHGSADYLDWLWDNTR